MAKSSKDGWTAIRVHQQYQHRSQREWIVTIVLLSQQFNQPNHEEGLLVIFQNTRTDRVNLETSYHLTCAEFRKQFMAIEPTPPPSHTPTLPTIPRKFLVPPQK